MSKNEISSFYFWLPFLTGKDYTSLHSVSRTWNQLVDRLEYFRFKRQQFRNTKKQYQLLEKDDIQTLSWRIKSPLLSQKPVTPEWRAIMIEWLFLHNTGENLDHEIFFQSVTFMDRFTRKMRLECMHYQLIAAVCHSLACKMELDDYENEEFNESRFVTDYQYTVKQMIHAECIVLRQLNYDLLAPTPLAFLRILLVYFPLPTRETKLAHCLLAYSQVYPQIATSSFSLLAISIYAYTSQICVPSISYLEALELTQFTQKDLHPWILHIQHIHHEATRFSRQGIIKHFYPDLDDFPSALISPKADKQILQNGTL